MYDVKGGSGVTANLWGRGEGHLNKLVFINEIE